jgi:hypothetical protein
MRMTLDRLTAQDYETLRRRQAQLLKSDLKSNPPPPSRRARSSVNLTAEQIEQLRLALLNAFLWWTVECWLTFPSRSSRQWS